MLLYLDPKWSFGSKTCLFFQDSELHFYRLQNDLWWFTQSVLEGKLLSLREITQQNTPFFCCCFVCFAPKRYWRGNFFVEFSRLSSLKTRVFVRYFTLYPSIHKKKAFKNLSPPKKGIFVAKKSGGNFVAEFFTVVLLSLPSKECVVFYGGKREVIPLACMVPEDSMTCFS